MAGDVKSIAVNGHGVNDVDRHSNSMKSLTRPKLIGRADSLSMGR